MNLIFYEQRLAEYREEVEEVIKTNKLSNQQLLTMLEDCENEGFVPEFLTDLTLHIGILQQIIWALEIEMETKNG